MEGGFHTVFVTYVSGLLAVARKDFPLLLMFRMVCGFYVFCLFLENKVLQCGQKVLKFL